LPGFLYSRDIQLCFCVSLYPVYADFYLKTSRILKFGTDIYHTTKQKIQFQASGSRENTLSMYRRKQKRRGTTRGQACSVIPDRDDQSDNIFYVISCENEKNNIKKVILKVFSDFSGVF